MSASGATATLPAARGLADRLRRGETVLSAWVGLPEPLVAEALARTGHDAVTLDMQHGLHDPVSVMQGVAAIIAADRPAIVRVALGDFAMASRALDFGASAVIAPMVNSTADARALVDATKFPPLGRRSYGPGRAMTLLGLTSPEAYLTWTATGVLALGMVETREGLADVEAILDVGGLDGVFVGPFDLSLTLSDGAAADPWSPDLTEPLRAIAAAARARNKIAGIFAPTPERARDFAELGYRLISLTTDSGAIAIGAETLLRAFRSGPAPS